MPRRFFFPCLALIFTSAFSLLDSASAAELSAPERSTLLAQLRELHTKQPSLQADFTEQKTTHLLNHPVLSEGTISFQAPDKFRREVRDKNPSVTVSNGRTLWIYYPNFKEVETYALGQRAFFDDSLAALTAGLNFQRIDEFYNFRAFREGDTYRLELVPKRPNLRRIVEELVLTLDSDFRPQRTDLKLPKGDRLVTNYRNARRTPLPASTFEFSPPADAHVSKPLGK